MSTLTLSALNVSKPTSKFMWGAIGGLVPLLASLALVDAGSLAEQLREIDLYYLAGYVLRIVILIIIGGIWALLHRSEKDPIKLIQLGIVAPAMITGMINATTLDEVRNQDRDDEKPRVSFNFTLISSAYAQDERIDEDREKPSPIQTVIKGFFGK